LELGAEKMMGDEVAEDRGDVLLLLKTVVGLEMRSRIFRMVERLREVDEKAETRSQILKRLLIEVVAMRKRYVV
jgi:hypothetical protein